MWLGAVSKGKNHALPTLLIDTYNELTSLVNELGSLLGPLLFTVFINGTDNGTEHILRIFQIVQNCKEWLVHEISRWLLSIFRDGTTITFLSNPFQYFLTLTGKKVSLLYLRGWYWRQYCFHCAAVHRDLKKWADRNLMKFDKEKEKVLPPGRNKSIHQMGWRQAGNQPCKKGPVDPAGHQVKCKLSSVPL